jgi:hypothetical protein
VRPTLLQYQESDHSKISIHADAISESHLLKITASVTLKSTQSEKNRFGAIAAAQLQQHPTRN